MLFNFKKSPQWLPVGRLIVFLPWHDYIASVFRPLCTLFNFTRIMVHCMQFCVKERRFFNVTARHLLKQNAYIGYVFGRDRVSPSVLVFFASPGISEATNVCCSVALAAWYDSLSGDNNIICLWLFIIWSLYALRRRITFSMINDVSCRPTILVPFVRKHTLVVCIRKQRSVPFDMLGDYGKVKQRSDCRQTLHIYS
jgi:hypothetical protein